MTSCHDVTPWLYKPQCGDIFLVSNPYYNRNSEEIVYSAQILAMKDEISSPTSWRHVMTLSHHPNTTAKFVSTYATQIYVETEKNLIFNKSKN